MKSCLDSWCWEGQCRHWHTHTDLFCSQLKRLFNPSELVFIHSRRQSTIKGQWPSLGTLPCGLQIAYGMDWYFLLGLIHLLLLQERVKPHRKFHPVNHGEAVAQIKGVCFRKGPSASYLYVQKKIDLSRPTANGTYLVSQLLRPSPCHLGLQPAPPWCLQTREIGRECSVYWVVTANPKQTGRYSRGLGVLEKNRDDLGSIDNLDRAGVCVNFYRWCPASNPSYCIYLRHPPLS